SKGRGQLNLAGLLPLRQSQLSPAKIDLKFAHILCEGSDMGETVLPGAADAQRWALLIGINEYQKLPAKYNLQGCINDVTAIEELLTNPQFAFPAQNILKLTS